MSTGDLFGKLRAPSLPPSASVDIVEASCSAADLDLEAFDDHEDEHLADPPLAAPHILVERLGGDFEVSRIRDNGSTVASVRWTRAELEEFVMRAQFVLAER